MNRKNAGNLHLEEKQLMFKGPPDHPFAAGRETVNV